MKKSLIFILVTLIPMLLFGCTQNASNIKNGDTNVKPGIIGYIMSKDKGRILVIDPEPKDFSSTGGIHEYYEAIWFSEVPEDIALGEKVRIWFNIVLDSYPAQSDIDKIEVIPSQSPAGATLTESEAINEALNSKEIETDFFLTVKFIEYDKENCQWNIELKQIMGDKTYDIIINDPGLLKTSN